MQPALCLNFDNSVAPMPGLEILPLSHLQDELRYGCSFRSLERTPLPGAPPKLAFLGSGDFHHVSYHLIRRLESKGRFQVVVFDNHPDNMLFPWGIHCGSWVYHASRLPFVSHVTVVGITSDDVGWKHLWENHLGTLCRGKVSYLCLRPVSRLAQRMGMEDIRGVGWPAVLGRSADPVYLSIDKDVLAPDVVQTNWDQGILSEDQLMEAVQFLKPRVLAADVTGEISFHRYSAAWKRILSRLDGQSAGTVSDFGSVRAKHHELNRKLLSILLSTSEK